MTIRFGTDGWRAIIADEFTFENVRICAQATADLLKAAGMAERGLVVGYDTRFASDRFAEAVADVAAASGVPVAISEGPVPTPVLSHGVVDRRAGGGVAITASHN
ncbi:MAG: phosphoglucomutase/phosphomannomutase family protein, partial [Dehalococcoidia bacterium]|nr:phosphoglucomutase/phosphomannomutase family protein [Dehalococcoidia bacterium]